jgi:hypothetical protein
VRPAVCRTVCVGVVPAAVLRIESSVRSMQPAVLCLSTGQPVNLSTGVPPCLVVRVSGCSGRPRIHYTLSKRDEGSMNKVGGGWAAPDGCVSAAGERLINACMCVWRTCI